MRTNQILLHSALQIFEAPELEKGCIPHVLDSQWFGSELQPDQLALAGSTLGLCGLLRFD